MPASIVGHGSDILLGAAYLICSAGQKRRLGVAGVVYASFMTDPNDVLLIARPITRSLKDILFQVKPSTST